MKKSHKFILEVYEKGYRVSKDGSVTSKHGPIKTTLDNTGKGYFRFTINSKLYKSTKTIQVHRMQAYQKYGMKMFEEGICVRHLNGNSHDNSYDNIAIGTLSDNQMDRPKEDRIKYAINASSFMRRFTDEQVQEILIDRVNGYTYKELCEKYDTSKSTLSYLFNHALYK